MSGGPSSSPPPPPVHTGLACVVPFSVARLYSVKWSDDWSIGKDSPNRSIIPEYVYRMWGKPRKLSVNNSLMESSPSWEAANCAAFQELPKIFGIQSFIAAFTNALHWFLSWVRSMQFIPSHPISLRYILTLSTNLCPGLPSGLFTSGFPTNSIFSLLPINGHGI
jgi:hypothetical protein